MSSAADDEVYLVRLELARLGIRELLERGEEWPDDALGRVVRSVDSCEDYAAFGSAA